MSQDRRSQKRVIVYRAEVPHVSERYEVVYESLADALHFACRDLATERRRPLALIEDGIVILDADQIAQECASGRAGSSPSEETTESGESLAE